MYVITALTMVNSQCAESYPWLYESATPGIYARYRLYTTPAQTDTTNLLQLLLGGGNLLGNLPTLLEQMPPLEPLPPLALMPPPEVTEATVAIDTIDTIDTTDTTELTVTGTATAEEELIGNLLNVLNGLNTPTGSTDTID
jgi:hypothetical protein